MACLITRISLPFPTVHGLFHYEDFPCFSPQFMDCFMIGRDLVRLLQNVARIPEFEQLWKDILHNPQVLSSQFTGTTPGHSLKNPIFPGFFPKSCKGKPGIPSQETSWDP